MFPSKGEITITKHPTTDQKVHANLKKSQSDDTAQIPPVISNLLHPKGIRQCDIREEAKRNHNRYDFLGYYVLLLLCDPQRPRCGFSVSISQGFLGVDFDVWRP